MLSSFKLDVIFAELDFVMHLVEKSATIDWADASDARKWFENLPDNVVREILQNAKERGYNTDNLIWVKQK